jgi:hypothetical protein
MKFSQDWIDDCVRYYGKVLDGDKGHWCMDWDDLPIDETCSEFDCCNCVLLSPESKAIVETMISNPPAPTEALIEAASRFKETK